MFLGKLNWMEPQAVRVRGTYGTESQSSRHSHLDWTGLGLVANKQRKDRMPHIWDLTCVPVPRSTAGTYLRMQAVKNKNKKKKIKSKILGHPCLRCSPRRNVYIYMEVSVYTCIHARSGYIRYTVLYEDTRMWAVKKQRKYHHCGLMGFGFEIRG